MSNSTPLSFKNETRMSPQAVYPSEILSESFGYSRTSDTLVPVWALVDMEILIYEDPVKVYNGHVSTTVKATVFLFV